MERVSLHSASENSWVLLQELTGRDELAVEGPTLVDAIRLLDGLLVEAPGSSVGARKAASLTAADRVGCWRRSTSAPTARRLEVPYVVRIADRLLISTSLCRTCWLFSIPMKKICQE